MPRSDDVSYVCVYVLFIYFYLCYAAFSLSPSTPTHLHLVSPDVFSATPTVLHTYEPFV